MGLFTLFFRYVMIPLRNCYLFSKRIAFSGIFIVCCVLVANGYRIYTNNKSQIESSNHTWNILPKNESNKVVTALVAENDVANSNSAKVHAFYYPWYGNPTDDSVYLHWNHKYIPNWDKSNREVYPTGKHEPPDDIGANYYPFLGCYSSRNLDTIHQHLQWIQESGIGVMVVSWYPPDQADLEGKPFDQLFPLILDAARDFKVKIAFHIEPYTGRTPENFKTNLEYIIQKYGNHPSTFKLAKYPLAKDLPVFYIYDSYLNSPDSWHAYLSKDGKNSIRGTELDAVFLGLLVELRHKQDIVRGGFDGFYTYFAANGFTYGSSWKNWKNLGSFARRNGLMFVPSVGPGYVDTRVRPWNSKNIRPRNNGKYYRVAWKSALQSQPHLISITSFNEWHERTQIEPAIPKSYQNYTYLDYQSNGTKFYLKLTRQCVNEYAKLL